LRHSKIYQKGLVRAPFQFFTSRKGYHNIIDMDQLAAKKIKEDNNDNVINDGTVIESVLSCRGGRSSARSFVTQYVLRHGADFAV